MWIIEKDPLQRDKSPFGKLATNPLQDTPWSDAYFPAMVLVHQVFFVMTKVLGVSKFNLLFLNFGKLIEGRSKHHVKPQRSKS